MDTLTRISEHLPNVTIGDPLDRITIDAQGRVWVAEDTTHLVLKGHLIIEAELIDICGRLLKNPRALEAENIRFSLRLKLVRSLVGDDAMPQGFWRAIEDLNKIRNALAHNLEPKESESLLQKFFGRFDAFEDCRAALRRHKEDSIPQRLKSCILFLCGALSGIGKSIDTHADEVGQ